LAALYSQEDPWYAFLIEAETTQEGLGKLKTPIISSDIEPAIFQLVA
jgi:hypothetical protein